ncbi:hypothetical protein AMS68_006034 [Peltaster fructicola]|uniref:Nucleoside transporter n=1 Tax=Peltaster fructicola TaxID=286661 RepID=A0A6H0Y0I6_9PEZI|nr:hypothetical protein AMS68_006034 [Peltaster fructicola]
MDRLRKLWQGEQAYEPLDNSVASLDTDADTQPVGKDRQFSWLEYGVFFLLGIAMLWSWNMFLAAGPYFQKRFHSNQGIYDNFQAAEISVSTITNLVSMLILTRLQTGANYPRRIIAALLINTLVFSLLAISTAIESSAEAYFGFLITMIFTTSLATGLIQNGIFAYVAGFGIPQYTQGIMTGQAVAGVLPCLAQIISVLSVRPEDQSSAKPGSPAVRSTAATAYFLTAAIISVLTLAAFLYLAARNRRPIHTVTPTTHDTVDETTTKTVPMSVLVGKLRWLAGGVIVVFAVTMVFPVFTQRIISVRPSAEQSLLFQPASFIPLAFLFWNAGDLLGRLLTAVPSLSLTARPRLVFILAVCRFAWIGLYHLCNIRGHGAAIDSDFFYLVVVQLLFGLTNGFLGSTCMIGAAQWVEPGQREATGGFMSLCLVIGLTVGSLASFGLNV